MMRSLVFAASLFLAGVASAHSDLTTVMANVGQQFVKDGIIPAGLHLNKGDEADYKLTIGGFINGTMQMLVEDVTADGVWIDQNMDLGFAGKQQMRELIDPNTGEIKKLIVNGKEQAPPSNGDTQVIDSKEDNATVPAGTFDCLYIKANVTQDGQQSTVEEWIDMKDVPVMGLVKMITQSQLGPVTVELTSFKRQ